MPTFVTRRTALGVATATVLASLTACASDIRPLEDPSRFVDTFKACICSSGGIVQHDRTQAVQTKKGEAPARSLNYMRELPSSL